MKNYIKIIFNQKITQVMKEFITINTKDKQLILSKAFSTRQMKDKQVILKQIQKIIENKIIFNKKNNIHKIIWIIRDNSKYSKQDNNYF